MTRCKLLLLATLLMLALGNSVEAQTPIWLEVSFEGLKSLNPKLGDGEAKLRDELVKVFETDFPVYNWKPGAKNGAWVLRLTFIVELDTKEMVGSFAFDRKPPLEMPGDDGPLIKLGNRSSIDEFSHQPLRLADHFHEKLKMPLAKLGQKWKDFLCTGIEVAHGPANNLYNPPEMQVRFPFAHPSYQQNWFNVKGVQPGQGQVLLEVEGLSVAQNQLSARIESWTFGKKKGAPPANVGQFLNALQQVRVYLQSMEPSVDPMFMGPPNP